MYQASRDVSLAKINLDSLSLSRKDLDENLIYKLEEKRLKEYNVIEN
jgi:hypothetical protein